MKKDTLVEIVLGTIGGLIFALGMCMCLIPKWDMFALGVVLSIVGFIILLCIIPIYKKSHPKKGRKKINKNLIITWTVGICGSLIMGFGMSKVLVENVSKNDMIIGMIFGIIGLLICVLNYPIYSYIKSNK